MLQARGRASVEASNAPRAPTWHCSNSALAHGDPSSGNSPRGSHNHSLQPPTYHAGAHRQEAEEAAGMAEDEVLSPHLSRLAETSPHPDTAEPVVLPSSSIGHQRNTDPACSSAQQPTAASVHQHALPEGEDPTVEEQSAREKGLSHPPGVFGAPDANVSPDAGPSGSAALHSADVAASRPRRCHASTSEAPHPAGLSAPRARHGHLGHLASLSANREQASQACEAPHADLPAPRHGHAGSMLRRSTATAAQSRPQNHNGRASPVPRSPPGVSSPSAHGAMHPRAALASPGRAESGSPSSSVLADCPGPNAQGHQADDSSNAQLQQRQHSDANAETRGVVDSFVGAIMQEGSDDEGNGEVVDERGMFQQCYKGHCNLSLNKEVMLHAGPFIHGVYLSMSMFLSWVETIRQRCKGQSCIWLVPRAMQQPAQRGCGA